MASLFSKWKSFAADEAGSTAIEYALIAGIIAIAIVVSLTAARDELSSTFTKIGTELSANAAN